MGLSVTSPAFADGDTLPAKYTCDGENISPPIDWGPLPADTMSVAFLMDDPDDSTAPGGIFTHWTLVNLPPQTPGLPEGVPNDGVLPDGAIQGRNGFGALGYGGPEPIPGSGPDRYRFQVFALSWELDVEPGVSRAAVLEAMEGRILAEGVLTAKY